MQRTIWTWIGAAACAAALQGAVRAEGLSVAVVDMDRIMRSTPEMKTGLDALETQIRAFEDQRRETREKTDAMKDGVQKAIEDAEDKALSDAARDEKTDAAKAKIRDLQEFERKSREKLMLKQKDMAEQEMQLRRQVSRKIRAAIDDHAAKQKIDLVIDSSAVTASGMDMILFSSSALDITPAILKEMGIAEKDAAAVKDAPEPKLPTATE